MGAKNQTAKKRRPIGFLIDRAMPAIRFNQYSFKVVNWIREEKMSANEIYNKAFELKPIAPLIFAQSARWLAIIHRDYGPKVFQIVIELVLEIREQETKTEA